MRDVNGKYIRESEYVPPKTRRYVDHAWTTTRDLPSGRVRLLVYSPYRSVSWSATYQETKARTLTQDIPQIMKSIEREVAPMIEKMQEADRQAEIWRLERLAEEERRRQEDDRCRIALSVKEIFAELDGLITYRVNAARAQSPLRRYMAIARSLTMDEIDDDTWDVAKRQIVDWMGQRIAAIKTAGQFNAAVKAITQVGLRTLAVQNGTGVSEPVADYHIDASDVDIDRLFEEAGRAFSHGLQMDYWRAHADRDALEVKVEAIVLARNAAEMAKLEAQAEAAFDALYDQHKKAIFKLKEQRRANYEKLRLATAQPNEVPWHLPAAIDFKRLPTDPLWERHLYVEANGQFRAELGTWEAAVLKEELAKPEVVGWLRNLDRKPWSLEIPYASGGDVRPMFPDLVVVRKSGSEFAIDILEPHDPSLSDNFEKAVGLAKFAEKHGALFGHIQLIRKQSSAGGEHFARLEINQAATIKKLLLITSNPQLDDLFAAASN